MSHKKDEASSQNQSHRKTSVIRNKISNFEQATSDINDSTLSSNTSDISKGQCRNRFEGQKGSVSIDCENPSSRENKDLLGVNLYTESISSQSTAPFVSRTTFSSSNDSFSHPVTSDNRSENTNCSRLNEGGSTDCDAALQDTNATNINPSMPDPFLNVSAHIPTNLSQADGSMCNNENYSAQSAKADSSPKDNFSKPFPPKQTGKKGDLTNANISSKSGKGEICDNYSGSNISVKNNRVSERMGELEFEKCITSSLQQSDIANFDNPALSTASSSLPDGDRNTKFDKSSIADNTSSKKDLKSDRNVPEKVRKVILNEKYH